MNTPNMLAYTIKSTGSSSGSPPQIVVGQGPTKATIGPTNPADDTFWFAFLDHNNPKNKVQDFVVPGSNNTTIPAGVDQYMTSPNCIFVFSTQFLSLLHLPQGPFFDYLIKFGAGRELQRIEQLNSAYGCGSIGRPTYILTGQTGPRGNNIPSPPSYELGSVGGATQYLTMSLMPMPNGNPPYGISDELIRTNP
jgi:hypothetical protein